jgi:signal transduction histidine kinase/ligand-binding sensor domain-containing protein/DNA-binding response OmpR family regulator
MWIHTWSGTQVYDPATESFDRNTSDVLQRLGIPEGQINDIKKDARGNYWFITTSGLFKYSERNHRTLQIHHADGDTSTIATNQIAAWNEDVKGNIWILHSNGILEMIDPFTAKVTYRNDWLNEKFRNAVLEYNLTSDSDGDLWFYITNNNSGVFQLRPSSETWTHIDNTTERPRLNSNIVRGIVEDEHGILWIATDHGGINLLNKKDRSVRYVMNNREDDKSLSQNSINVLYKDADGIIWAGTFKNGLSYYHKKINRFQLYRNQLSNPESLPFNDINAIVEDDKHNLWIGTNGGGLIYFDRNKNTFKQFLHDPHSKNSLTTNVIVSLFIDHNNVLWIGTYFGGMLSFDGERFTSYRHNPDNPRSISDNSIWEIFEDSKGMLWIGTLTQGVDRFDRATGEFHHYNVNLPNSIHASYVPSFMEDREGHLWIGTGYGIDVLDQKTGRFTHYLNNIRDPRSLSNNTVLAMYQDSRGLIWIATHGGLNVFDKTTQTFSAYTVDDGLPHNSVLTILEDNRHNLWLSTPHGIANVVVAYSPGAQDSLSIDVKNYDETDGLQGVQFNENAACKTTAGELIFAGSNGFNLFRPEGIGINHVLPRVVLTDFQIFNRSVKIGESVEGNVALTESITQADTVFLQYSDNVFSIEFASLSQFHPEKSAYQYILEGFNKRWTTTHAAQRRVTYTNLDPGNYVFKVKASNNDGIWNEKPAQLTIIVKPPFWKTRAAFVLYALATLGALLLARWLILYNERLNFQIEHERQEAHRMHELDMIKIKFFTNVSHEFRTPLTLILTPLEKILRSARDGEQRKQFELIHRNARRLLSLVNQLLDFRRMEVQEIHYNPSEGDLVKFTREAFLSFSDLSEKKNIRFSFKTDVQQLETLFDQDKLEKILFNLLSNAFKFTPEDGAVTVALRVVQEESNRYVEIDVRDTGIGIAKDKHEKIFERFFQSDLPRTMVNQGSGIGLSITREFVKIHGGAIRVESEPGRGSCFTVRLPLAELAHHVMEESPQLTLPEAEIDQLEEVTPMHGERKPVLLLVEDNEDFRFYLKDNLQLQYRVVEAKNGREGFDRASSMIPDLVVSDIMMPEMNGIELCRKLKTDPRTSHIPVLLLTARTAEEQKIEGFDSGANDYVTKPFNFEILQSRIRNLIAQREAFQRTFNKHIEVKAGDVEITSLDEKLIRKAIHIVEEHIGDADFSVERFSRELGMSRVHLYKKLLALTGKSPIEFIRNIRLQRAAQLLKKSQLSVSEIAYQVGFNNPKYFSKYFKDQFNILPSAYANGSK